MRRFVLTQDIAADVATHWKMFFDPDLERELHLTWLKSSDYRVLESRDSDAEIVRKIRVVPKLDLPGPVAKLIGSGFAYTEAGNFDRKAQVWRSRLTPGVLSERMHAESVVRCEPAGAAACKRTCELTVDARIFGIGGVVESAFEKNLRQGWTQAAAFLNAKLKGKSPGADGAGGASS
jgi:uncharacterized protein DUF2505